MTSKTPQGQNKKEATGKIWVRHWGELEGHLEGGAVDHRLLGVLCGWDCGLRHHSLWREGRKMSESGVPGCPEQEIMTPLSVSSGVHSGAPEPGIRVLLLPTTESQGTQLSVGLSFCPFPSGIAPAYSSGP
jgi:hypothetical protein